MFSEYIQAFLKLLQTNEAENLLEHLLETFKTNPLGGLLETIVTFVISFPTTIFPGLVALLMDLGLIN